MNRFLSLMALGVALGALASPSFALDMYWSNNADFTGADNGDILFWDPDAPVNTTAQVVVTEGALFTGNEHIDALHKLPDGTFVMSTSGGATLDLAGPNLTVQDEDLFLYDPATDTASIYADMSGLLSGGGVDIDAVHVIDDNLLLLSSTGTVSVGALTFQDEDLFTYDRTTGSFALAFDLTGIWDDGDADVVAVYQRGNGNLLLSTLADEAINGVAFRDDHVFEYNPASGQVVRLLTTVAPLPGAQDIRAFTLSEPTLAGLLAAAGLFAFGRRRRA